MSTKEEKIYGPEIPEQFFEDQIYQAIETTRRIYNGEDSINRHPGYKQYNDAITLMYILGNNRNFDHMFVIGCSDGHPEDHLSPRDAKSLHLLMRGQDNKWYATETQPEENEQLVTSGKSLDKVMDTLVKTNGDLPSPAYIDVALLTNKIYPPDVTPGWSVEYSIGLYFSRFTRSGQGRFFQGIGSDGSALDVKPVEMRWTLS